MFKNRNLSDEVKPGLIVKLKGRGDITLRVGKNRKKQTVGITYIIKPTLEEEILNEEDNTHR